jgi:multiple sugar transport system substrate-binding protein
VQVDDILATAVEDSVFYGKDPATTMSEAQKRAQALIEK